MRVPVADIRLDVTTQPRVSMNLAVVEEYTEEIKAGATFPAVVLFDDGNVKWMADGYHRLYAHQNLHLTEIEADVRKGTREDAAWFSCSANQGHGLRRTNPDKRRAAETALRLRPNESARAIAEHCGVSDTLVNDVKRQLLESSNSKPGPTKGKDGKTYKSAGAAKAKGGKASAAARAAKKPATRVVYEEPPEEPEDEAGDASVPVTPPPQPAPAPPLRFDGGKVADGQHRTGAALAYDRALAAVLDLPRAQQQDLAVEVLKRLGIIVKVAA